MKFPERIVPDETAPGIVALHLKRYDFARPYCVGKDVLDAGCGVGYGSAFLAESARSVVGVDVDDEALAYARGRYVAPTLEFVHGDLLSLAFEADRFDTVCAFEVIEHLGQPERFLDEAARVLRDGGTFVLSTPHARETTWSPENPFHEVELSRADFEEMLRARFANVEVFGQRRLQTAPYRFAQRLDVLGLRRRLRLLRRASRLLGTPSTEDVTLDGIVISREGIERATELVAVCRQ